MKDKRVVLGPPKLGAAKKTWKRSITTNLDRINVLLGLNELDYMFECSNKLQMQVGGLMLSLQSVQKNQSTDPKTAQALSDRLRPLIALKEDIDVYICQKCEEILDAMEMEWKVEGGKWRQSDDE